MLVAVSLVENVTVAVLAVMEEVAILEMVGVVSLVGDQVVVTL